MHFFNCELKLGSLWNGTCTTLARVNAHLVEEGDVEGEPELVLQPDLVAELIAQFPRGGRRVGEQRLGRAVHEGDGQHERLLRLGRLQLQPRRRLVARPVVERALQPLLAVGGVTWSRSRPPSLSTFLLQLEPTITSDRTTPALPGKL